MDYACEEEEGDKGTIGGERGTVAVDGVLDGADIQSTICVGAEDDCVWGDGGGHSAA